MVGAMPGTDLRLDTWLTYYVSLKGEIDPQIRDYIAGQLRNFCLCQLPDFEILADTLEDGEMIALLGCDGPCED
jgi:hypothetical protein